MKLPNTPFRLLLHQSMVLLVALVLSMPTSAREMFVWFDLRGGNAERTAPEFIKASNRGSLELRPMAFTSTDPRA